jgi:probable HAF family extracellular repeat protein
MRPVAICGLLLTGLTACENPTTPDASPSAATSGALEAVAQQFTVRSLGTLGGEFSGANSINELGQVAGFSQLPSGETHAMLWRPGQGMRSLGTLGGANSRARTINDRGEVVGHSEVRPGSDVNRAFLWTEAGGIRGLGSLGGRNSFGSFINNRQEVAGTSQLANGEVRAFLWRRGQGMQSLGTLGGSRSEPWDLNDATQVVGGAETADGEEHAFLWTEGHGMEDLGTLGGSWSRAGGISQTGVVVGASETAEGTLKLFLWTRSGGMRSLGSPGGNPELLIATSINTHRGVVGITFPAGPVIDQPLFWMPGGGGIQHLPTLGGPNGVVWDINELGQMVGTTWTAGNRIRATLWTPIGGALAGSPTAEGETAARGAP